MTIRRRDSPDRTGGVKSDETLFDIVEHLHDNPASGVTAIANEFGLAKSTVHSHLTTLKERGYVLQDETGYRLGLKFLDLGIVARNRRKEFELIKQTVDDLAEETGEQVWFWVEENGTGVVLYSSWGERAVRTNGRIGLRVPLHSTAGGKAILARLPQERVRAIIEQRGLPELTEHTISTEAELFDELEQVRERNVSINVSDHIRGMNAIGVPVVDNEGRLYGSISVSGPANRLREEVLRDEYADLLDGVSTELGINLTFL